MENLINETLMALAKTNEGFCSEAHFQHEFALYFAKTGKFERIILERLYPSEDVKEKDIYLDVWMKAQTGRRIGIELKYKTLADNIQILPGEFIPLKNQRASDLGRYGFWKDVERLEQLKHNNKIDVGYALFLTNDFNYWKSDGKVSKGRRTLDADFSLPSGREVAGELNWGKITREAGKKHWTENCPVIKLSGQYKIPNWINFREDRNFRYLFLEAVIS